MKRNVRVILGRIDYSLDLKDLKKMIEQAEERSALENISGVTINVGYNRGYYDDVSPYLEIYGYRRETDEEESIREYAEKLEKEQQQASLRAHLLHQMKKAEKVKLLEQLKKELEG